MTEWLVLPATLAQERELRGSPDRVGWRNLGLAWRLAGAPGAKAVRGTLAAIAERHEILRTGVREIDGAVMQVVAPAVAPPLAVIDLEPLRGRRRARALRQAALAAMQPPFDLTDPPLWRATLVRLGAREHLLLLAVSHTIWDAYSSLVFARELEHACAPPAVQLGDVAAWEHTVADAGREAYWARELRAGPRRLALAIDRDRAAAGHYRGRHVELPMLPPWVGRALGAVARAEGTTLAAAFLAVFALLLRGEGDDVVVGVDEANRDRPETRALIGYLLDVMPVRVRLRPRATFRELVAGAGVALATAYRHRLPLRRLAALAPAGEPLYEATLNVRPYGLAPAGAAVRHCSPPVATADFPVAAVWWEAHLDLSLDVLPSGAVGGELGYDAAAVAPAVAERIAGAYPALARRAAHFPARVAVRP